MICQVSREEIAQLSVSDNMKIILLESEELRTLRKIARLTAHQSKNNSTAPGDGFICGICAGRPLNEKCVRVLQVRLVDQHSIHGCALVPYALHDPDSVLPKVNFILCTEISVLTRSKKVPKPSGKGKKESENVTLTEPPRISLESVGLDGITERPEVRTRCGRDVTFLVNEEDKEEVAPFGKVVKMLIHSPSVIAGGRNDFWSTCRRRARLSPEEEK
jgi:hypothetical protein